MADRTNTHNSCAQRGPDKHVHPPSLIEVTLTIFGPRRVKTCLRGLRTTKAQTSLRFRAV